MGLRDFHTVSNTLFCSISRYIQMANLIILLMATMKKRVTGCAMWIQHTLFKNRIWQLAKMAWISISTPSSLFQPIRNCLYGTAGTLQTDLTIHPLESWWWISVSRLNCKRKGMLGMFLVLPMQFYTVLQPIITWVQLPSRSDREHSDV